MSLNNLILNTDSYKLSHHLQYPGDTRTISSYIEARGISDRAEIVFFGLQIFLKEYLSKPITAADIAEAGPIIEAHGLPFNQAGWLHILDAHDGYLPLRIEALDEGTLVKRGVPLVQVTNTDPQVPWLTSYIETALLRSVWYPTSVTSNSRAIKQIIRASLEKTSDDPAGALPFKLHDFGARGVSSLEQAGIGGAAHLVNFMGTDTMTGVLFARKYYGEEMAGFSIPASEHSTMTSWGRDHEADAYANMVRQFGGEGRIYAVVSDSYNLDDAVENIWGEQLREQVEQAGGTLVVRPDSGDTVATPIRVIEQLARKFGTHVNSKGYRVLADCVRVIQGDGIGLNEVAAILERLERRGFSADNIAFGMGARLLQMVNRDTYSLAMKANARRDANGDWHDVYKQPQGTSAKNSKAGQQAVIMLDGDLSAVRLDALGAEKNYLRPVWENGKLLTDHTFAQVRARAE